MEVIQICPLGAECERIGADKDGNAVLYRCRAYTLLRGKLPDRDEQVDQWRCSIFEWLPILLVENSQMTRGVNAAVSDLKNETVKRQDVAMRALAMGFQPIMSIENVESTDS
jgi:hypothetical protein